MRQKSSKIKTLARTVKLAELIAPLTRIPKIYIILGECPNFQGEEAGKIRENEQNQGIPLLCTLESGQL